MASGPVQGLRVNYQLLNSRVRVRCAPGDSRELTFGGLVCCRTNQNNNAFVYLIALRIPLGYGAMVEEWPG